MQKYGSISKVNEERFVDHLCAEGLFMSGDDE
jgi:hypothetical protein